MKPTNRHEVFLDALAKGETCGVEPVTREEMFIKQIAEREASGGASWNSLTDRPFGVISEKTEVMPETELNMTKPSGWNRFVHWFDVNVFSGFKVGQKFVVVLDGVEYVAPYYTQYDNAYIGDNTPELPFRVTSEAGSYGILSESYVATDNGTEKTFALYALNEETVTLDPVYLPKAAAVPDASGDTPTAAEFNALLAALRNAGYLAT